MQYHFVFSSWQYGKRVDGTLIDFDDNPRWDVIEMLKTLSVKHTIIVWSGGGKDYARVWVDRLFLRDFVTESRDKPLKMAPVNISFDDEDVALASVNVRI